MAGPNITKLPTPPWSVLAGASILLHAGVWSTGLPQILPVENPGDSSVNIPVTLVGDDVVPVAASDNFPQVAPQVPATQPSGQTTPVASTQQPPTQQEVPAQLKVPQPETSAPSPPKPKPVSDPPQDPTPADPLPAADTGKPPSDEPAGGNAQGADSGPTQVTILSVAPVSQPDRTEPKGLFQPPITVAIPSDPNCPGSLSESTARIDLTVRVDEAGYVLTAYTDGLKPDDVTVEKADCLFIAAVNDNSAAIQFTPAEYVIPDVSLAEKNAVSAVTLSLEFSWAN